MAPARRGRGGVSLTGVGETELEKVFRISTGGVVLRGHAPLVVVLRGRGGVTLGGHGYWTIKRKGKGSGVFGGSARIEIHVSMSGRGGIQVGGKAPKTLELIRGGTIRVGGKATASRESTRAGSGGITIGGTAYRRIPVKRRLKIPTGIRQEYFTGVNRKTGFRAPPIPNLIEKRFVEMCVVANLPPGYSIIRMEYDPMYWPTTSIHLKLQTEIPSMTYECKVFIGSVRPWGPQVARRLAEWLNRNVA